MKKLYYYVKPLENGNREIIVFKDGKCLPELECLKNFKSDHEEIQEFLDNDQDSEEYEFININLILEDDAVFIIDELMDKFIFEFIIEDKSRVKLYLFEYEIGEVDVWDDSDVYYSIEEENGIVTDLDFVRYNYININHSVTYLSTLEQKEN